ncbi:DUF6268 family outer membrane beta-barrel protein [Shewanella sp. AS1]|uniref:DUF6268 family outer membrane beta-barrel protein n=1 Tax=Shewanella sp. AS1 TaxID=2907626 RepID=UPI001F464A2F|nr:DUF6268 family outer membrane beta-barrel protein [Shewanella sp. AS1]MCE9679243.1 DUF6268 family outer membrane beta-barrel protein [Shewanella sp. AS1]
MKFFAKSCGIGLSVLVSYLGYQSDLQAAEFHFPTSASVTYVTTSEADIDNTQQQLQRDEFMFRARTTIPLTQRWSVSLGGGYDRLNYDWGQKNQALFNNLGAWPTVDRYNASVAVSYVFSPRWVFMVAPTVQYAYAEGTSASNAQSYGVLGSAMMRLDNGSMIGFGLAYLNDIEEVRILPYVSVSWQITDKLRLGNPFSAGFSGGGGLELSYQMSDRFDVGVGASSRTERFLVRDDDVVMEISDIVSFVRAGWHATSALTINGYLGYYFNSELELSEPNMDMDMDNQLAMGLSIGFDF